MFPLILQITSERLDWFGYGVSSINRTAAFIASAILASWIFTFIPHKKSFWISVLTSLILFWFLIQTQSRGAFLALLIAFPIMLLRCKFEYNAIRLISLLFLGIAVFFAASFYSGFLSRVENMVMLQSSSANCRGDIYISGVKMLTDAPYGLKVDKSPVEIYMRWYQNPDDSETYISMLNSHLEFLCQYGFGLRICYILFWSFIFVLTIPLKRDSINSMAFSIWLCFGICACFSNVMNYWVLWIIPSAFLALSIIHNRTKFRDLKIFAYTFILAVLAVSSLYTVSYFLPRPYQLKFANDGVVTLGKNPRHLLFSPMEKVLGTSYGSSLIQYCKDNDLSVIVSSEKASRQFDSAIICDTKKIDKISAINAKRIVYLNSPKPSVLPIHSKNSVLIILGRMSDWRNRLAWEYAVKDNHNLKMKILEGVGDYIPDWPKYFSDEID